ncbi:hypothetical protein Pelo_12511 [Pelomyxa schiedti]|nr:hypothetical protein Pelo_12511 [Pelomyxa schiedti]
MLRAPPWAHHIHLSCRVLDLQRRHGCVGLSPFSPADAPIHQISPVLELKGVSLGFLSQSLWSGVEPSSLETNTPFYYQTNKSGCDVIVIAKKVRQFCGM